jgi:hypothetical protein
MQPVFTRACRNPRMESESNASGIQCAGTARTLSVDILQAGVVTAQNGEFVESA